MDLVGGMRYSECHSTESLRELSSVGRRNEYTDVSWAGTIGLASRTQRTMPGEMAAQMQAIQQWGTRASEAVGGMQGI